MGVEPEGWVGQDASEAGFAGSPVSGDTWCPLRVGNYSKPWVLKEPEGRRVLIRQQANGLPIPAPLTNASDYV